MKRGILAILAGLIVWTVVATVLNLGVRLAIPGYHAAEASFDYTLAMKIARLCLAAAATLAAGHVAGSIARGQILPPRLLGFLILLLFLPVHYNLWDRFPVWYHLTFLGSLVPLTILGARWARDNLSVENR